MNVPNAQKSKVVYVNSKFREDTSDTTNDFSILVDIPQNNEFSRMSLVSCHLPKSYYMIDSANNTFILQESTGPAANTVTLRVGNYSVSDLLAEVSFALTQTSTASGNSFTYTVTFDSKTGKMTFTKTGTGTFSFLMNDDIASYLGFDTIAPYQSPVSVANSLTSSNVCSLRRYLSMFVRCSLANNNGDDVLMPILTSDTPDFGIIDFENVDVHGTSVAVSNNQTNIARFSIVDDFGVPINLNNVDWAAYIGFYV